jgi:hypothetical protein
MQKGRPLPELGTTSRMSSPTSFNTSRHLFPFDALFARIIPRGGLRICQQTQAGIDNLSVGRNTGPSSEHGDLPRRSENGGLR